MHQQRRQPTTSTQEAASSGASPSTADLKSSLMLRKSSSYSAVKAELMKLDMQAISSSATTTVTQGHRMSTGDIKMSNSSIHATATADNRLRRHGQKLRRSGSCELPPDGGSSSPRRNSGGTDYFSVYVTSEGAAPSRSSFSGTPSAITYNPVINMNFYRPVLVNGKLWAAPAGVLQSETNSVKVSKNPFQKEEMTGATQNDMYSSAGIAPTNYGSRMAPSSSPNNSSKWDNAEKWVVSSSSPSHNGGVAARHHTYSNMSPYTYVSHGAKASCNSSPLNITVATSLPPPLQEHIAVQKQQQSSGVAAADEVPPPSSSTSTTTNSPYHNYSARSLGSALQRHANYTHDARCFPNGGLSVKERQQHYQRRRRTDVHTLTDAEHQEATHDVYVADIDVEKDAVDFDRTRHSAATSAAGFVTDWGKMPYPVEALLPESLMEMNGAAPNYGTTHRSTTGGRTPPIFSKKVLITKSTSPCAPMRDASTDASPQRSDRSGISTNLRDNAAAAARRGSSDANKSPSLRDVGTQITPSPSSAASRSSTPLKSPRRFININMRREVDIVDRDLQVRHKSTSSGAGDLNVFSVRDSQLASGSAGRPNTPAHERRNADKSGAAGRQSCDIPAATSGGDAGNAALGGEAAGSTTDGGSHRRGILDLLASSDSTLASSASSGSNNWERSEANDGSKPQQLQSKANQDVSRLEREEARIDAWEMHQKAKADAELQKLEVKLGRMRERATEKIMRRVAAAKARAEGMRAVARASWGGAGNQDASAGNQAQQQPQQQQAAAASSPGILRKGCFPILQP